MAVNRSRWQSDRGAELIEFALVMPMLLFIIEAIVDFGMMFRDFEVVTNAAREGARVGVLPGYEDPNDVQARVNAYLTAGGLNTVGQACPPSPGTVCVEDVPVSTAAGTFTARSVRVQYVYDTGILGGFSPMFGGTFGAVNLNAVAVMRTETQAAP
jgi:Flp pilus assembly protein TadG